MTKKLISIITSIIMCIGCFSISVSAKVIEPEFVKTESWTTSYYIDDDMDTLYPYIQCEADIYNDGTIKLYMWNTHEWDGFATVKHRITSICTIPVSSESDVYYQTYKNTTNNGRLYCTTDITDLSFFDVNYAFYENFYPFEETSKSYELYSKSGATYSQSGTVRYLFLNEALPELTVGSKTGTMRSRMMLEFKPKVDPTGTYNFRLFGHDITITPELLSGNIISEPELTEQEKYIKQLEEENAKLKASITNTNLFGDINGDNLVDVADAQMILNYYVYTLANSNAEPLEEWISKQ